MTSQFSHIFFLAVYSDDATLIPRNTSVIIMRKPKLAQQKLPKTQSVYFYSCSYVLMFVFSLCVRLKDPTLPQVVVCVYYHYIYVYHGKKINSIVIILIDYSGFTIITRITWRVCDGSI